MICVKKYTWLLSAIVLFAAVACKKKKNDGPPPVIPTLTTTPVSNITTNSAVSGGTITSDGGDAIIASGICYSKTIQFPTIDASDDTTKGTVGSGSFTAELRDLESGIIYYVRAYAINSAGIAYGNVVYFNSANAGPEARNIIIVGTVRVPETIRARYTYFDAEQNPGGTPTFQWYVADDSTTAGTPIANATDSLLAIAPAHQSKFLKVVITPRALTGTTTGVPTSSKWVGPVAQPETVTFTYNGQSVTYGVITSAVTSRKWLDRNLGAPNVATTKIDWQNMGDLFQWGRGADGHQLIIRRPPGVLNGTVNGNTTTLSNQDNPGHSLFITTDTVPYNWRVPKNPNLWQISTGINNVCPTGWHVPSKDDWEAEQLGNEDNAYTRLKLTLAGSRDSEDGRVGGVGFDGRYWTSTATESGDLVFPSALILTTTISYVSVTNPPASGLPVRCIKD
jgi:uncharacterized protein (TIGR02145 family)